MYRQCIMIIFALTILCVKVKGQHQFEIGGGPSYSSIHGKNRFGWHARLEWNLRVDKNLLFSTLVGMDQIHLSERSLPFQLYKTGLGLKYFIIDPISIRLGVNAALVDDVGEQLFDLYPTISFQYQIPLHLRHALSIGVRGDFVGLMLSNRDKIFIPALAVSYQFLYGKTWNGKN
jgi:hypothetical protein